MSWSGCGRRGSGTAFDLEAGPLIRGRLIQLGEEEHALLITHAPHRLRRMVDGGAVQGAEHAVRRFRARAKAIRCRSWRSSMPDYAVWQRKWMEGEILQRQAEYWKEHLAGAPALLELPADHARPAQQDYAGAVCRLVLDGELTAELKELSQRHGTTLFMTLLAAWAALLAGCRGSRMW